MWSAVLRLARSIGPWAVRLVVLAWPLVAGNDAAQKRLLALLQRWWTSVQGRRSAADRARGRLDAVEATITDLAPQDSSAEAAERYAAWRRRSDRLRAALPLVQTATGREGLRRARQLDAQLRALEREVILAALGTPQEPT